MPLGAEVGVGPGDIVVWGWGAQPPKFLAHICCGQIARWIKMPLGMQVGLGPGHMVPRWASAQATLC